MKTPETAGVGDSLQKPDCVGAKVGPDREEFGKRETRVVCAERKKAQPCCNEGRFKLRETEATNQKGRDLLDEAPWRWEDTAESTELDGFA